MNINNPVPPTQTVVISGQPIKTDATVQNASLDTNATIQNFPSSQDVVATSVPAPLDLAVPDNADSQSPVGSAGILPVLARIQGVDNTGKYDRIGSFVPYDGESNLICLVTGAHGMRYVGNVWDMARTPSTFKSGGGGLLTTTTTIWTPASGKKFRLMGFEIGITPDLSYTTATAINGYLQDGTTQLPFLITVYAPSTVTPSMGQQRCGPINLGNGYLSSAANNALGIKFSVASVGGVFFMNAWGTEE